MLSLVGIDNKRYRFVELSSFKVIEMTREELINYFNSGGKADNIELKGTYLDGTNGNLRRYKDGTNTNSLVVLYKSIERDGEYYYVANSLGEIAKMNTDTLIREGRKYAIANGQIATIGTGKDERVIIKSIRGSFREVKPKVYKALDLEDYLKLYRLYKRINNGVYSESAVGTVIGESNPNGFVMERKIVEPDFDSFVINYKLVQAKITASRSYTYTKIYGSYRITLTDGKFRIVCKELIGYLVNLTKEQMTVFIPASDKNIGQRLNTGRLLHNNIKASLISIFTYGRDEINTNDSIKTCEQIYKGFNVDVLDKARKELEESGELIIQVNDDYTFNIGSQSGVMMRYNINIRARDFRGLRGRM